MAGEQNQAVRLPPPQSVRELEVRAGALAGHTVREVAVGLRITVPDDNRRSKGFTGQLVERALGADPKAGERPDFPGLGVELKTIPVDVQGIPVESTFCCSINMLHATQELWEDSRLKRRLQRVLWMPVEAAKVAPLPERRFGRAVVWCPDAQEMALLHADWEDLMGAVGAGRGSTLSAREGHVLQVRPKAAHAGVRKLAPSPDGVQMALPLGFYLRAAFTAGILRRK